MTYTLDLFSALNLRFERGPEGLTNMFTFKPVLTHWTFIGIILSMIGIILAYAFFENFRPFLGLH